nr:VP1 protein [parechovirus C1]
GLTSWGSEMDLVDSLDNPTEIVNNVESNIESAHGQAPAVAAGLRSTENDGTLSEQLAVAQPRFLNFQIQDISMFAVSHTLVDHFFGRSWLAGQFNYTSQNTTTLQIPFPTTQHGAMARMFAYFSGEVTFHITHIGNCYILVTHTYYGNEEGRHRIYDLASNGAISIPPDTQMSLTVPFYSETPLRTVKGSNSKTSGLGTLFLRPVGQSGAAAGRITIYASIRCPNFFFPVPAPKRGTARAVLNSRPGHFDQSTVEALGMAEDLDSDLLLEQRVDDNLAMALMRAKAFFNRRQGCRSETLLQCGDVESNPG